MYAQLKSFGEDVYIAKNVVIKRPELVQIGSHVAIDDFFYVTTQLVLGDFIHIGPMVSIIGGRDGLLQCGNFVTIAAGSRIIVRGDEHLGVGLVSPVIPEIYRDKIIGNITVFEDFVGVGTNVVVMPNVRLAIGSVIGANSTVTKSTEPWTIYIGSPAKPIKPRRKDIMLQFAGKLGYKYD